MELKQIKDLMAVMGRTGIKKLSIKKENFELALERSDLECRAAESESEGIEEQSTRGEFEAQRAEAFLKGATHRLPVAEGVASLQESQGTQAQQGLFITSPMVGTFYAATAPEDPPYVKVGDRVEKGTVVCIIEAMKVMNEVKAGMSGTVVEVLIENGQPVEFGSKLFRIAP